MIAHLGVKASSIHQRDYLARLLKRHVAIDALAENGLAQPGQRPAVLDLVTGEAAPCNRVRVAQRNVDIVTGEAGHCLAEAKTKAPL
jgi:hypothetical protein